MLARELAGEAALLLVSNPVFRLDFAAVAEIHGRLMAARNCGAAVPRVRRWPAPPTPAPGAVGAPGAPVCDPGRCAASARPATAPRPYPHPLSPPAIPTRYPAVAEVAAARARLDFTKTARVAATCDEPARILGAITRRRADDAQRLLRAHIDFPAE